MSLAQYASPYNNDSDVDNKNQKNQGVKKMSAAHSSSLPSSSLRKTIKRPLQSSQQSQQSQQSQSRVSDFMNKLNSQSTTTTTYIGDEDGGGAGSYGPYGDSEDLADYNPITEQPHQQQQQQQEQTGGNSSSSQHDNAVTKESFMDLPSSYAKQYYQQYVPYNQSAAAALKTVSQPKEELLEKMNHIIHMLEEQQDEKTGNVTEELILYCFLGVFVIFVVDSFARAGKYVR